MAVNIGPKISVDGEAEYREAMKKIIAQTKVLDSEMKLLVSTFDSSTSAEEQNAKMSDILRQKAEQQGEAIEALKMQLEQAQKAFGKNSTEALEYQRRLNDMKTALNSTEAELRDLAEGVGNTSDAMDDGTDSEAAFLAAIKNITQKTKTLDSEMRLLVSTFDASTSAEERNAKTAEILKRKAEQQSQAVALLAKQLEVAQSAYGENSTAALEYQRRLNDMQAELNDTESELGNLTNGLNDTSGAMDAGAGGALTISGIFKGGLFAHLAAKAIEYLRDKIKEFAKESIEAAASVKALDSSWAQTFGDMEGTADEVLDRVADSTGVMAERLKEAGQQIFAFNKASGADSVEALGTMERALTTAADLAAYYDKSVEEVTDSLLSFMKGNYANDAALGISSTEYTRNAAAVEMYGKKFNDLTETMKQNVLLHTVEQAAELSGAMGQAAREADAWENVQGNLNETWKQFEAAVGTPVLSLLIPVLQGITIVVQELTDALSPDEVEQATIATEEFLSALDAGDMVFEQSAKDARALSDSIFSAANSVKKGTPEWDALRYKIQRLNQMYPGLNLQIDENTGALNMSADAVADFLDKADGYDEYARNQEKLTSIEQQRAQVAEALEIAEQALAAALAQVEGSAGAAGSALATATYNEAAEQVETLKSQAEQLDSEYNDLITTQGELEDAGYGLIESNDAQAASLQGVSDSALSYINRLAEIEAGYEEAYQSALDSIKSQQGLWDDFNAESEKTVDEILANWQKQADFSRDYAENMTSALERPIEGMEEMVRSIDDGTAESMVILERLANGTEEEVQAIIDAFNVREEGQSAMANTMRGIEYSYEDMIEQLMDEADADINEIISILENPEAYQTASGEAMDAYLAGLDAELPALRSTAQAMKEAILEELSNIVIPVKAEMQYDTGALRKSGLVNQLTSQYNKAKVWAY